jgi:N-acetylglucosaminyl-diphospho-decaprenol L-rhamnosyltransferase
VPGSTTDAVVDVVIVSFRSRELLRACLASLEADTAAPALAVHVVDNASADGTLEMLAGEFPLVRVTPRKWNSGFGAATNLGIRAGAAPYVLALNPDTRVETGTLAALVTLMQERREVGICGCWLMREDGSFDHASRRSFPTIAGALGHFLGIGRSPTAPRALAQYRAPDVERGEVDAVNGAFMLMRRAMLEEVGLFDEGFWMYMEDLDLCYRTRAAGWQVWYEPSVAATHVKGGTSGPVRSSRLTLAFHYGMYRFYRKHYAPQRAWATNLIVYAGIAAKLALALARASTERAVRHVRVDARADARP